MACPTIILNPPTLTPGTSGTPYFQAITVTGGVAPLTLTFTTGSPPPGLFLTQGSPGSLVGVPTIAGTYNFTITATDANQCSGPRFYSLTITCPTIALNPQSLTPATTGTPYFQAITVTGGVAPVPLTFTTGSPPPGLFLIQGSPGSLAGTPTTPGTYGFTITATDANLCTGPRLYSLVVASANTAPSLTRGPLASGARGTSGSLTLATVADLESAAGSLVVTITSVATGLTVTDLANTNGTITATVALSCTAALGGGAIGLQVSDGTLTGTGTFIDTVTINETPPLVTVPNPFSVIVNQTTCSPANGATLTRLSTRFPSKFTALSALVDGGDALDDCTSVPTRLTTQLSGSDVTNATLFPLGESRLLIRFADADGNIGTAALAVMVRSEGDVTDEGSLDVFDVISTASLIVGNIQAGSPPFSAPLLTADVDGSGVVDIFDLVLLAGFIVGNVSCLSP